MVLFNAAVGYLQMHVHARGINVLALLQHLGAFGFHLLEGNVCQVCQTDFSNARVGLGDVTLNLRLRGSVQEWI